MLNWFGYYYSNTMADQQDPRLNLVKADFRNLPPMTIVNAQIDPLCSALRGRAAMLIAVPERDHVVAP